MAYRENRQTRGTFRVGTDSCQECGATNAKYVGLSGQPLCENCFRKADYPRCARCGKITSLGFGACPSCGSYEKVTPSIQARKRRSTRTPLFKCQECGHKFFSVKSAENASFGDSGCPGCGGSDIDTYTE